MSRVRGWNCCCAFTAEQVQEVEGNAANLLALWVTVPAVHLMQHAPYDCFGYIWKTIACCALAKTSWRAQATHLQCYQHCN